MACQFLDKLRFLTALVLALGLFGCDQGNSSVPPAPKNTFRIVSSLPTRGYAAEQTKQIERAIQLAIQEGKRYLSTPDVEYLALDYSDDETGEWSRDKELANAKQAADDASVVAYIGPYNSGAAMVSIPVTNRAGLLQASPSATWPGLTQGGYNPGEPDIYYPTSIRNFVSMMPDDSLQAKVAAQWADLLDLNSVIVLADGSTYSAGLASRFEQYAGMMARSRLAIDPLNLTGLTAQVGQAEAVFYAPSSVQNALAVARALGGAGIQVLSTDVALDPQFLDSAGEDAARWHIISNSVPEPPLLSSTTGEGAEFRRIYQRTYGATPGQFAANAYDITYQILNGLAALEAQNPGAGPDRAGVLKYVLSSEHGGATGVVKFAEEGRPVYSRMSGYVWREGRFRLANIFQASP